MSGADWRQQQELEEEQWEHENPDVFDFVQGQKARKSGGKLPANKSDSFVRGWIAERELEQTSPL